MGVQEDFDNKLEELRGAAKEKAGEVTDNEQWQAEGKGEQIKADLKQSAEKVKDAVKEAKPGD